MLPLLLFFTFNESWNNEYIFLHLFLKETVRKKKRRKKCTGQEMLKKLEAVKLF